MVHSILPQRNGSSLFLSYCKCFAFHSSAGQLIQVHRFLASTHYTNYNPWLFAINISALVFVLIPKLPQVRIHPLCLSISVNLNVYTAPSSTGPIFSRRRIRNEYPRYSQLPSIRTWNPGAGKARPCRYHRGTFPIAQFIQNYYSWNFGNGVFARI